MSIHTLTIDELLQLTRADHEEALNLYDVAISKILGQARTLEADYDGFAEDRDKLTRLLTLRKVHQGLLDELLGEEPAPRPVLQQYFDNELRELPS